MSAVAMTAPEKARDLKIRELGCIACYIQYGVLGTPTSVHHMTSRGRRKGHTFTIPLCPPHHKGGDKCSCKLPFHHNKVGFESAYGTQEELFELTNKLIGYTPEMIAEMAAREVKVETGLRQKSPKKPRKTTAKAKPASTAIKVTPKEKRAAPSARKVPSRPLPKIKPPKPSPEMLARQKALQKEAKERFLLKNAAQIESVKERARKAAAELRRAAGKQGLIGKTKGPKVSTKVVARRPGQFY